jgi:putative transposase
MRHRVVTRDPAAEGFVVLVQRWVIERSFSWFSHWSGLARDRAGRLDVAAARTALAYAFAGMQALLNPMPIRALA